MRTVALERLSAAYGLETEYQDDRGRRHRSDPDATLAVLRALDAPVEAMSDASDALRVEQRRRRDLVVEPVTAARAGQPVRIRVRIPASDGPARLLLRHEDGSVATVPSDQVVPVGSSATEGTVSDEYRVELSPRGLGLGVGYHELLIEGSRQAWSGMVVVAPPCPPAARGWGGFLPVQAFRSQHNLGVGSYPELAGMAEWISSLGGSFVGTLPLFPTFLDTPYEPSPYLPVTRLGWSELFIDPGATPEAAAHPALGPTGADESVRLDALREADSLRYRTVAATVRRALEPLARTLFATDSVRRRHLFDFAAARPDLVAYGGFRSAVEQGRRPPPRTSDATHVDPWHLDDAGRLHLYAQFVAEEQLAASDGRLYLDLPVGVHPDGFDAWWESGSFATGANGGAPPDAFFASGQNWGFRPLDPRRLRHDRYRHPIAYLRHLMRHASVVRIDHIAGLHRIYWIPDGAPADLGVYVRYRLDEWLAIVSLEAHRAGCTVVGEDLGTVPDLVRTAMDHARVLRSWVLQFEASPSDPLPDPPETSLATIGTHDLPRFAPFVTGGDIDETVRRGAQDEAWAAAERTRRAAWRAVLPGAPTSPPGDPVDTGLQACLVHLAKSRAAMTMVDLEDLWGEHRQINRPGSGGDERNWTARMAPTLTAMETDPSVLTLLGEVDAGRRATLRPTDRWSPADTRHTSHDHVHDHDHDHDHDGGSL